MSYLRQPWAILLCIAACVPSTALGQTPLPVQIEVDHAAFAYSPESSLVEVYLAVDAASLDFVRTGEVFAATLPIDIAILKSSETAPADAETGAVWSDSLLLRFSLPDTVGIAPGQHFIHQIRTAVPPGEFELRLKIPPVEQTNRREFELRRDILVPDFARTGETVLSDITLASSIESSQERTIPFYKNGLLVRPNANQLFGQGLSRVYYYAEAYEAPAAANESDEYTLFAFVSEANRPQPIGGLQNRTVREARSPDVIVGEFDVSELPSGSYFLRIAVLNRENEAVVEQARKFFIYNPTVRRPETPVVEMDFETSPYAAMPEEEVALGLDHISIIANESDRRRIRRIQDLNEKRRYLMDFWQKRDDQPGTPVNEFKEEFYRRLQYANDRYSSNRQEGWRTDRGRVIIRYGIPTSIDPHLYDRNAEPHEIWQYNNIPGEGQALFVFADLSGFGDFELLHSTVAGERSLPDWQQQLGRR